MAVNQPRQPNTVVVSDNDYICDKLELVAFLLTHGLQVKTFRRNQGRVRFYFDGSAGGLEQCKTLRDEFMLGPALVCARDYANHLNWARSALHQV